MKFTTVFMITSLFLSLLAVLLHLPGSGEKSVCHAMTPPGKIVIMPEVTVNQKRVCLFDLCRSGSVSAEWQGLLKGEDLGEAPSVGSHKYILAEHLRTYLNRFFSEKGYDPAQIEIELPEKIVIQRASVKLPREQIEAIYKEFVFSHSPWDPRDVEIHRVYFPDVPELPEGKIYHEVVADPEERFLGNVTVTIQFFVDGEKERNLRVTGKVDLYQNVVHALTPLRRNDIVGERNIEFQRINVAGDPDRFATRAEQVVGKELLRDVGMHQPIAIKDLNQPNVVKRGGVVTIVYQDGGLKLTAKGEVNGDACIGDTIRVTNLMTNRATICMVVDEKTVQVIH